ncbi:hypothetical protein BJN44_13550 [Tessaracoccus sp. ZS01]|nr:hypothetical protein BJN44_13550 [Tessaracoccus sp. ZS01]
MASERVERTSSQRDSVDLESAVSRYLIHRDPEARYASFDYCFNHFQQHRTAIATWGHPHGMQASCFQLAFYLASWGMLRGSSGLFRRSARHLAPLVETISNAPDEVWSLDLDGYDSHGIELVQWTASAIRGALLPIEASDTLVTKIMLGVFGCVPAFDTYFRKGFGVSTFSPAALRQIADFYQRNRNSIDQARLPTLDFTSGRPTGLLYTRAKVLDMAFFIEGGYPG